MADCLESSAAIFHPLPLGHSLSVNSERNILRETALKPEAKLSWRKIVAKDLNNYHYYFGGVPDNSGIVYSTKPDSNY